MNQSDVAQFERIVLPYLDDAYTLARYLVRDEHDAQDVVQEAALRAFRYFGGYSGGDARSWLLSIVRNCSFTWMQRRRTDERILPLTDGGLEVSTGRDADAAAIASSENVLLATAPIQNLHIY